MADSAKAVFLSYAREDLAAARRIADALRAAGVEVWFDEAELRGGDSWDGKIRNQIKECALFVPIISANTQARSEGYFRIEWRLADRRTEAMGKSKVFLVPVCIDDTRDAEADVPDSFLTVQWTRLPGGETPRAFAERVELALSGEVVARTSPPAPATPAGGTPALPRNATRRWVVPAASIVVAIDRIIAADDQNADAGALRGIINSLQVMRNFVADTKPLETGRVAANRALHLAPRSPLGELALVEPLARGRARTLYSSRVLVREEFCDAFASSRLRVKLGLECLGIHEEKRCFA